MLTSFIITLAFIILFAGATYALGRFIGKENYYAGALDYYIAFVLIAAGVFIFSLLFVVVNIVRSMI